MLFRFGAKGRESYQKKTSGIHCLQSVYLTNPVETHRGETTPESSLESRREGELYEGSSSILSIIIGQMSRSNNLVVVARRVGRTDVSEQSAH